MKKAIFVLMLVVCAFPASAQWDWSMPGSAGVVGDGTASLGVYTFAGSAFSVTTGSTGTVDARYPVTNTVGSVTDLTPGWTTLQIAVHDAYTTSGVTATLYEVDKCSSTETQICSVTSSETDQDVHCNTCTFSSTTFDFANNAYYVYVSINNSVSTAGAALYELAVY